jgi:hypothetical protein
MPDIALADSLEVSAKRLLAETSESFVSSDDVARAIDVDPEDDRLYEAWRLIERRGIMRVEAWPGGMGNPQQIGL